QQACAQVEQIVDIDRERPLVDVEKELWTALLAVERYAIGLFLALQAARLRALEYQHEGVDYKLDRRRKATTEVGTLFGKVRFVRPVGRRADGRRGPRDLPVDRSIGLAGAF